MKERSLRSSADLAALQPHVGHNPRLRRSTVPKSISPTKDGVRGLLQRSRGSGARQVASCGACGPPRRREAAPACSMGASTAARRDSQTALGAVRSSSRILPPRSSRSGGLLMVPCLQEVDACRREKPPAVLPREDPERHPQAFTSSRRRTAARRGSGSKSGRFLTARRELEARSPSRGDFCSELGIGAGVCFPRAWPPRLPALLRAEKACAEHSLRRAFLEGEFVFVRPARRCLFSSGPFRLTRLLGRPARSCSCVWGSSTFCPDSQLLRFGGSCGCRWGPCLRFGCEAGSRGLASADQLLQPLPLPALVSPSLALLPAEAPFACSLDSPRATPTAARYDTNRCQRERQAERGAEERRERCLVSRCHLANSRPPGAASRRGGYIDRRRRCRRRASPSRVADGQSDSRRLLIGGFVA